MRSGRIANSEPGEPNPDHAEVFGGCMSKMKHWYLVALLLGIFQMLYVLFHWLNIREFKRKLPDAVQVQNFHCG